MVVYLKIWKGNLDEFEKEEMGWWSGIIIRLWFVVLIVFCEVICVILLLWGQNEWLCEVLKNEIGYDWIWWYFVVGIWLKNERWDIVCVLLNDPTTTRIVKTKQERYFFPFQFQNKQQELCGVMKVRNGEFVCGYCFNTLTNPLKLPCGYDLCEECVLEGWGEEEINWERDKGVEWRRRVWGYCEEWYLKRERENGNERIGDLNEWNEWMIDFDVCEWWLRWNDIHSFLIILIISYHSIFIINTSQ